MAGGDEFDLTRGGEEDERKAPVLSLRRRGHLTPPPGTHPPNGAHRHLAARVQVPLTTPGEPAAGPRPQTLGWNEPPDAPRPAPQPAPQARSTPPRSARTPHRAIALATVLLTALISTAAVIITIDTKTSSGARAQAPTAPTDNAALFPTLALAGHLLAGEIDKLGSPIKRHGRPAAHSAVARKHHVAVRHASRSAPSSDRHTARTPGRAPVYQSSATTTAEQATNATTNTTPAASSPSSPSTARPTAAGSASPPSNSTGGEASQSGSHGSTTVRTGRPPCYPGTLGCQSP
jgi:hypothetical protein